MVSGYFASHGRDVGLGPLPVMGVLILPGGYKNFKNYRPERWLGSPEVGKGRRKRCQKKAGKVPGGGKENSVKSMDLDGIRGIAGISWTEGGSRHE
jgi:hypothetical protein